MKTVTLTVVAVVLSVLPGCGWFSKNETPAPPPTETPAPPVVPSVSPEAEIMGRLIELYQAGVDERNAALAERTRVRASSIEWLPLYLAQVKVLDTTERLMLRAADVAVMRSDNKVWVENVRQLAGVTLAEVVEADLVYGQAGYAAPGTDLNRELHRHHAQPPAVLRDRAAASVAASRSRVRW